MLCEKKSLNRRQKKKEKILELRRYFIDIIILNAFCFQFTTKKFLIETKMLRNILFFALCILAIFWMAYKKLNSELFHWIFYLKFYFCRVEEGEQNGRNFRIHKKYKRRYKKILSQLNSWFLSPYSFKSFWMHF